MKKAVYYLIKNKNGWPRFCNDKALCDGYIKNGVEKEIARERIAVGCHWMCVPGKEFPMNDTVKINLARVFELAFEEMMADGQPSVERLFQIYEIVYEDAYISNVLFNFAKGLVKGFLKA